MGKIALHIEKEMFSLFRVTDNRYKSKYRSLMFNLKDPKNQVCARRISVLSPEPRRAVNHFDPVPPPGRLPGAIGAGSLRSLPSLHPAPQNSCLPRQLRLLGARRTAASWSFCRPRL